MNALSLWENTMSIELFTQLLFGNGSACYSNPVEINKGVSKGTLLPPLLCNFCIDKVIVDQLQVIKQNV
jgi:hypothetical protein